MEEYLRQNFCGRDATVMGTPLSRQRPSRQVLLDLALTHLSLLLLGLSELALGSRLERSRSGAGAQIDPRSEPSALTLSLMEPGSDGNPVESRLEKAQFIDPLLYFDTDGQCKLVDEKGTRCKSVVECSQIQTGQQKKTSHRFSNSTRKAPKSMGVAASSTKWVPKSSLNKLLRLRSLDRTGVH